MANLATALALFSLLLSTALAACPSNYAAAGFSGPLTTIDHGVLPRPAAAVQASDHYSAGHAQCMPITSCAAEPTHWHKRQRYTCNAHNCEAGRCTAAAGA